MTQDLTITVACLLSIIVVISIYCMLLVEKVIKAKNDTIERLVHRNHTQHEDFIRHMKDHK